MSDAKTSIAILCKFVSFVCKYKIQPIYFKLAKHNKVEEDVVSKFWNLLNTLTETQTNANIVENVKIYFAGLNYKSLEFYSLPDDMSFGSRELLLAFSWLIGKHNILERLLKDAINNSLISQEFILTSSQHPQQQTQNFEHFTVQDYHNNILVLAGKINTNLKMISEYNDSILKLMEKVHKQTSIANNLHLSVAETHHLKNSHSLHSYLNEIKHISDLLDVDLNWKAKEKIYWEWMITVINLKNEDNSECINKDTLGSFFKVLRAHAKQLLASEPAKNTIEQFSEKEFSRCLRTNSKHSQTATLVKHDKYLRDINNEEKHNVQKIIHFLYTMIN